jgi:hypothetical protein
MGFVADGDEIPLPVHVGSDPVEGLDRPGDVGDYLDGRRPVSRRPTEGRSLGREPALLRVPDELGGRYPRFDPFRLHRSDPLYVSLGAGGLGVDR